MKTYRVAGPSEVFGHSPGTTFERELTEGEEERLIGGGAIAIAETPPESTSIPAVAEGKEFPDGTELEACSKCGKEYPKPAEETHTEEECLANQEATKAAESTPSSTSKRGGK